MDVVFGWSDVWYRVDRNRSSAGEGRRWAKEEVAGVVRGKLQVRDGRKSKRPMTFDSRRGEVRLCLGVCLRTVPWLA